MCTSTTYEGTPVVVTPRRGSIELSSRVIDAAVFECHLCGAVRCEPLQARAKAA